MWTGEVRFNHQWLDQPLRWRKPRRIFVCAHGDLFHESVPDEWIDRVFAVMALCPRHTFQVLTKRPGRMRDYLSHGGTRIRVTVRHAAARHFKIDPGPLPKALPNVWLGVSVEDQDRADERILPLLETPAAVRFVSCEPLLGPVTLDGISASRESENLLYSALGCGVLVPERLDWVIVGGESGPGARRCEVNWVRSIVAQCHIAGVPLFVKQLGGKPSATDNHEILMSWPDHVLFMPGIIMDPIRLRDPQGADPSEWPEELQVREWPVEAHAGD